jgi:hypothetical protein
MVVSNRLSVGLARAVRRSERAGDWAGGARLDDILVLVCVWAYCSMAVWVGVVISSGLVGRGRSQDHGLVGIVGGLHAVRAGELGGGRDGQQAGRLDARRRPGPGHVVGGAMSVWLARSISRWSWPWCVGCSGYVVASSACTTVPASTLSTNVPARCVWAGAEAAGMARGMCGLLELSGVVGSTCCGSAGDWCRWARASTS